MTRDPIDTDPELYRVLFENERVRVLEYHDRPGERTRPHRHPDSVMVTLSAFQRQLVSDGREIELEFAAGVARWLPGQEHSGHNTGQTDTRVIFVELKDPSTRHPGEDALGPSAS